MDSYYLKSSAVNQHHYALVHKVENATSVQEADKAIWDEVDRIKAELTRGLTTTRDDLVILMYCRTAAVTRSVAFADLEFALSPAVNLAATGRNVKDRRIGLTFCAQFMPPTHPLQLMLVNTLRKEIESDEIPRIVLAIDFIIACPSQFIGPAVAGRLEVLLGNKSQNLRHRALLALRALSTPDPNSEDPNDTESYLAQHAPTVMRRLNLQLDVTVSSQNTSAPNPNADLITLSALESPFRAETDFRTLSLDESDPSYNRASDPETPLSPRFHTAVMTSPRLGEGGDLSPSAADAIWSSFDSVEGDAASSLGKQTLRGWCERTPESLGNALRGLRVGFVTQKVGLESAREKEVFAFIPAPADSPDTEVARAVVRLKPADDGSCLWMLRCVEFQLRVKIRKALDGDLA